MCIGLQDKSKNVQKCINSWRPQSVATGTEVHEGPHFSGEAT
jgi:hypothetical protein